jgi:hypothetical protein
MKASQIEKATVGVQKEIRGTMGATTPAPKQYTEAEKNACSLDVMLKAGSARLVSEGYQVALTSIYL